MQYNTVKVWCCEMAVDEILATIKTFREPGDVVEVWYKRIGSSGYEQKDVAYYNDFEKLANDVDMIRVDKSIPAIYMGINPMSTDLLGRANNRILHKSLTRSTKKDVVKRTHFFVDIDPKRKSGKSATNKDHEQSIIKTQKISDYMVAMGWPEALIADSGNGGHAVWRCDLENTLESEMLIDDVLKYLTLKHECFENDNLEVQGFSDANRLIKLYGTEARKGDEVLELEEFHRHSKILNVPDEWGIVSLDQLEAVSALYRSEIAELQYKTDTKPRQTETKQPKNGKMFDVVVWCEKYEIKINGIIEGPDKTIYKVDCPFNPEHKDASIVQMNGGTLGFNCFHDSCNNKHWADYREFYEPGYKDKKKEKKDNAATLLIEYVKKDGVVLFHDDKHNPFARVPLKDKEVTLSVKDRAFKRWITQRYYESTGTAPGSEAISSALNVIEAMACFDGEEYKLFNRVCWYEGAIWYDLGNWEAVKITANFFEVIETSPILFKTYKHQKPLGTPHLSKTNSISKILHFINIKDEKHRLLFLVLLVSYFIPDIPHPILTLHGEKGAAKTTTFKIVKALVDPSTLQILTFPRDNTELIQKLSHHYYAPFDNVTKLSEWQSDALCRAVTGEGFSKRELYTDDEDVIYTFQRGIGLNGINVVATKPDLLDRIPKKERKTEGELWQAFNAHKSEIAASIFTVLSKAMAIQPTIKLDELPRMADFTVWGCAIAEALGYQKQEFLDAYYSNIQAQNREALEGSPIGELIIRFMEDRQKWRGGPSGLLNELDAIAEEHKINTKNKSYPKAANVLTRRINEIKTNLLDEGIFFTTGRDEKGRRFITLEGKDNTDNTDNTDKPTKTQTYATKNLDDTIDDTLTVSSKTKVSSRVSSKEKQERQTSIDGIDDIDGILPTPSSSPLSQYDYGQKTMEIINDWYPAKPNNPVESRSYIVPELIRLTGISHEAAFRHVTEAFKVKGWA